MQGFTLWSRPIKFGLPHRSTPQSQPHTTLMPATHTLTAMPSMPGMPSMSTVPAMGAMPAMATTMGTLHVPCAYAPVLPAPLPSEAALRMAIEARESIAAMRANGARALAPAA
eukprot:617146-Pleurochrysis_carterae.AAC.1